MTCTEHPEENRPSDSSQQLGCKLSPYAEADEFGQPHYDMTDPAPAFIASFSGTDLDR